MKKERRPQCYDAQLRKIKAWAEKTYMQKLQDVQNVDRKDGLILADLAASHADRRLSAYVSISL